MTVAVDLRALNAYTVTALDVSEVYVGPVCELYGQHTFICNGDGFYSNAVRAVLSVRTFIAFISLVAFYFSEIYRGGIQGVPIGQQEAGLVLGMTKSQIFFKVTLLQMIKRIVPPMSNEIITLVKDTSLARIIALQEIIWAGQAFMKGYNGISGQIWPLFFTAVYYLVFNGLLTVLLGKLEEKLNYFR